MATPRDDEATLDLEVSSLDEMHKTIVGAEDSQIDVCQDLPPEHCHARQREMLSQKFPVE